MKNITIWSDFACPFCYIGERRLKAAIKELGVEDEIEFTYRAFELNPDAPVKDTSKLTTVERMARKYGLTEEEAKKRVEAIDRLGRDLGIDFKFATVKPSNTFDAHRLMKFAEDQYERPVVEALNEELFKAYFTDNKVLSDRKLLMKIAEDVAMYPTQVNDVLERGLYADQVRFDEKEAAERGIHGVPYMLFDGEFTVPGAISTEDCKTAIREMLGRKKGTPEGMKASSCDESGCAL